ncbi:MAG: SDR family oxidoreductase, partial [Paracoccaceae bacterium]|nr:SDR family oxidoreductase [Paracoccaceae bacterium]
MNLAGRHILLSGAARGLGAVIARHLAEAGARLTLVDILEDEGREVAAALSATFHTVDLRDPESIAEVGRSLDGPLHGLFNNGAIATGIGGIGFEDVDVETWDRVMEVNVRGT